MHSKDGSFARLDTTAKSS